MRKTSLLTRLLCLLSAAVRSYSLVLEPPSISAGASHTCGVERDTNLANCWGLNLYGQTTLPDSTTKYLLISTGDWHSCGINSDTNLAACWGFNAIYGQTTIPDSTTKYSTITAGGFHTCGLKKDDDLALCCMGAQH